jgi:leader peptidase (prepilin peptidase)/N-methyltransferase
MYPELIPIYIVIFLFGIVIGSFLNVCIFRMPKHQTVVTERSHCMTCGYQLSWYDMVPVFSWLFLRGKCRKCKEPISPQYPIVEAVNGLLYVMIFAVKDFTLESILYCLLASALLVLSVIDWRTYEIPIEINILILVLGIIRVVTDPKNRMLYLLGFLSVSVFLWLILVISKGRAIGGGDVKLMAVAGLLLGWKLIILAFMLGGILGSIIHLLRMKISGADRVLAMGPYLAAGIMIAALWGDALINWYLTSIF